MPDRRINNAPLVPSIVIFALSLLVALAISLGLSPGSADAKQPSPPRPSVLGNGKGFALAGAVLSVPSSDGSWSYRLQAERWSPALLEKAKQAGFGYIRLIGDIRPITSPDPAARARGLAWINDRVNEANAAGLGVLVFIDYWPNSYDPSRTTDKVLPDPAARKVMIRAYADMAAKLVAQPGRKVALEFVSEPTCTPDSGPNAWPAVQLEMWKDVRRVAPTLPLVLTGCRGRVDTIVKIDPTPYAADRNIIWSFHYYDFFTAQEHGNLRGVPFPARPELAKPDAIKALMPAEKGPSDRWLASVLKYYLENDKGPATMQAKMGMVAAWAKRYGISPTHISMNEWGHLLKNEKLRPDALLWIRSLRQAAEKEGFSWAYWTLPPAEINYDPSTQFFRTDVLTAFGLKSEDSAAIPQSPQHSGQ